MLEFEHQTWAARYTDVGGIDEAGRGPLAGPVVAACVVFKACEAEALFAGALHGLTDSKKLSPQRRDAYYECLQRMRSVRIGVGICDVDVIDRINILQATHRAMQQAAGAVGTLDYALVDGRPVPGLPCPSRSIIGGDAKSLSIAAASIVAKVTRDRIMQRLDAVYPHYGFAAHKGYGTRAHKEALLTYGPCPIHRKTFEPVRSIITRLASCRTERRATD